MSTLIQGSQLRTLDLGTLVTRSAQGVPQTANANIFTITGGRVLITSLVGVVTTAFSATVTNLKLTSTPTSTTSAVSTAPAATDLCANTAVASLAVGQMIVLPATPAAATAATTPATTAYGQPTLFAYPGLLVPAGAISVTTSANNTGQLQWDLTWIPFDDGASVAAA